MGIFMDNKASLSKIKQNQILDNQPKGYGNLANFFIVFSILSAVISISSSIIMRIFDLSKSSDINETYKHLFFYNNIILVISFVVITATYILFRLKVKKGDNTLSLKMLDCYSLFFMSVNILNICVQLLTESITKGDILNYYNNISLVQTYSSYISFGWNFIIIAFLLFFVEKNISGKKICNLTITYIAVYLLYTFLDNIINTTGSILFTLLSTIIYCGGILLLGLYLKKIGGKRLAKDKNNYSIVLDKSDISMTGIFLIVFSAIGIAGSVILNIFSTYFSYGSKNTLFARGDIICISVILLSLAAYYVISKKLLMSNTKAIAFNTVFFMILLSLVLQLWVFRSALYRQFYIIFIILSCFMILVTAVFTKNKLLFIAPVCLLALTFVSGYLVEKLKPQYSAQDIMNSLNYFNRDNSYTLTKSIVDSLLSFAGLVFLGVFLIFLSKKMDCKKVGKTHITTQTRHK